MRGDTARHALSSPKPTWVCIKCPPARGSLSAPLGPAVSPPSLAGAEAAQSEASAGGGGKGWGEWRGGSRGWRRGGVAPALPWMLLWYILSRKALLQKSICLWLVRKEQASSQSS